MKLWKEKIITAKNIHKTNKISASIKLCRNLEKIQIRFEKYGFDQLSKILPKTQEKIKNQTNELIEIYGNLNKSVQNIINKQNMQKNEESKHNLHFLDQLNNQIKNIDKITTEICNKNSELKNQPENQAKIIKKLQSALKICKILIAPINLNSSMIRIFLRWRFRRVSQTSKLLTDDINKCFEKFRKTMLILLNRRILNKIATNFHIFIQKCEILKYEKSEEYKNIVFRKKSNKLLGILMNKFKYSVRNLGENTKKFVFAKWRKFVKTDIKNEFMRKKAMILFVFF